MICFLPLENIVQLAVELAKVFINQGCTVTLTLGPQQSFLFIINMYFGEGDYIIGAENSSVPREQA